MSRGYVPASWQGQRVFIRVGSACYFGTVYVNGVKVGSHEGGHLPFAFEITELSSGATKMSSPSAWRTSCSPRVCHPATSNTAGCRLPASRAPPTTSSRLPACTARWCCIRCRRPILKISPLSRYIEGQRWHGDVTRDVECTVTAQGALLLQVQWRLRCRVSRSGLPEWRG